MPSTSTYKLSSGAEMPTLGYGTWQAKPGQVGEGIAKAIEVGYRHLDAAFVYGNQREVGEGIKEGLKRVPGLKREDLLIVSKLWNSQHKPADVEPGLDACLEQLGLDYLDIYLIHFPVSFDSSNPHKELFPLEEGIEPKQTLIDDKTSIVDTWKAMTKLPKSKARAVGVSNFSVKHLETIIKATGETPVCNQVERHPRLQDHALLEFCKKHDIAIVAYSPLGNNMFSEPLLTEHETIKEIAQQVGASPGQVLIAWGQEHSCTVIPKTVTLSRVEENFKPVKLPTDAVKRIDEIGTKDPKRYNIPWLANKPAWPVNIFETPEEASLPHKVVLGA